MKNKKVNLTQLINFIKNYKVSTKKDKESKKECLKILQKLQKDMMSGGEGTRVPWTRVPWSSNRKSNSFTPL